MTTIKVYRNGSLAAPQHSAEVIGAWGRYDAVRPAGRTGRLDSLYASPSLLGNVRWIKGNHSVSSRAREADLSNNEITVLNPESVFVYSINTYEKGSWGNRATEAEYWATGIPLTDWERVAAERNLNPSDWEVLLPVASIKSARPVSDKRVIELAKDAFEREELVHLFKEYRKLLKWRNS